MSNSEIFKTAFKGYNKEEVVEYISLLNNQSQQLQAELDAARSQIDQLETECREKEESDAAKLQDEAHLREEIREEMVPGLTEKIRNEVEEVLRPQLEKELRAMIEEEVRSKYEDAVRTELNNRARNQAEEIAELRRRAQLYDNNREVLAELMIKAKNDAAAIVDEANAKAKKVEEEANQRFRLLQSDYELLKSNLLKAKEEAAEKLIAAGKSLDEFEKRFGCMDRDIELTESHL